MIITREWSMPNHNTFSIPPIKRMIARRLTDDGLWLDPFSRKTPFAGMQNMVTNDISHEFYAEHHMEALDFLQKYGNESVSGVLFDPPYSPRQISECYKGVGMKVHMEDTQSSFYTKRKVEVARVLRSGGIAICFGWNSGGIGKKLGFEMVEILLVAHGAAHNDTICTVEVKK